MFSKTVIVALAATLFASANAHLAIQNPPPIPGSDSKSPLDPSGSNFPCQGADLSGGSVTNMAAGSTQPLKFNLGDGGANWAVHGGGSCQISITYETDKTKLKDPANWKVLHSWVGGCPTNAPGNLSPSAIACTAAGGTNCVTQDFTFTVPSEVKSGNAIIAWTWFNNIGNREMYMNCAKVAVTGGTGNLAGLPSMFAANIGNGCSTTEQFNTDFPNPGNYVTKDSALNYPLKAPQGSCGSGAGSASVSSTPSSSGSGSSTGTSSGSSSSGAASGSATAPSAAPSKSATGGKGGAFAEGASTPSAAPVPTAAATTSSSGSGSGSCKNGAVSCSASGFYCIDSSHFGECAFGCAVPMSMAAGTSCTNNAVAHAVSRKRRWNLFNRL